jgi:hypothetical protein
MTASLSSVGKLANDAIVAGNRELCDARELAGVCRRKVCGGATQFEIDSGGGVGDSYLLPLPEKVTCAPLDSHSMNV